MLRKGRKTEAGFTMVEVMVTTILLAIALVGAYSGMAAVDKARAYAATADKLQRLAVEKIADISITQDPSSAGGNGDFSDRGDPNDTWVATVNSTSVTDLYELDVTVSEGKQSQTVDTQFYEAPATTTSTTGSTTATGAAGG